MKKRNGAGQPLRADLVFENPGCFPGSGVLFAKRASRVGKGHDWTRRGRDFPERALTVGDGISIGLQNALLLSKRPNCSMLGMTLHNHGVSLTGGHSDSG